MQQLRAWGTKARVAALGARIARSPEAWSLRGRRGRTSSHALMSNALV